MKRIEPANIISLLNKMECIMTGEDMHEELEQLEHDMIQITPAFIYIELHGDGMNSQGKQYERFTP
jgi:hypothetical protein